MNTDPERSYTAPFAAGSDTSTAAAASVEPTAWSLAGMILEAIRLAKANGYTCSEIEIVFDLRHQTASARIWDLHTRGFVVDSGARRVNPSGRKAVVWVIPKYARKPEPDVIG